MSNVLSSAANRGLITRVTALVIATTHSDQPLPIIGLYNDSLYKYNHQVAAIVKTFEVSYVSVRCVLLSFCSCKERWIVKIGTGQSESSLGVSLPVARLRNIEGGGLGLE